MSNYPAGVSDSHPYFNPKEGTFNLECGADSALVVPSYTVKGELIELEQFLDKLCRFNPNDVPMLQDIKGRVTKLKERVEELEVESEYECPFSGDVDTAESECAQWDCPTCGNERESDTVPEDVDPDRGWDDRD